MKYYILLFIFVFSCKPQTANFSDVYSEPYSENYEYIDGEKWCLELIVVHCTASTGTRSVEFFEKVWHDNGWSRVGYSYLIKKDGTIWVWVEHNFDAFIDPSEITNGVRGLNHKAVHIAYEGGVDRQLKPIDNINKAQLKSLKWLVSLHKLEAPSAKVRGHKDVQIYTNKACPSFDVSTKLRYN